jgi:hypothetical protein
MGESRVRSLVDPFFMTRDVLSVSTRREWSRLPALAVRPDLHERRRSSSRIVGELSKALGPVFPILSHPDDGTLVLLPLCSPSEVRDVAARLRNLPTKMIVEERTVSFEQLVEAAPFRWIDGERGGVVIASDGETVQLCPPVNGWESVRADPTRLNISLSA